VESEVILFFVLATLVIVILAVIAFLFMLLLQKRRQKFEQDKESLMLAYQKTSLQAQLEIQEETFKNISQEIHDNIGQTLSFIKLSLNTVNLSDHASALHRIAEANQELTRVIQDLRDLSKGLNADYIIHNGLINSIRQQLNLLEKAGTFGTSISVNCEVIKLPVNKELILFRMIQELLNNIVKHAGATSIEVAVDCIDSKLLILIQDDGNGFDNEQLKAAENEHKGIGLKNIFSRISFINGVIDFQKREPHGSVVKIEVDV
jgi:signal transduction histidine kinase